MQQYYKDQRADDDGCHKMILTYSEQCLDEDENPTQPFNFVQYHEQAKASEAVIHDDHGKMMWEEEYYEFARKPKGGSMSVPAMKAHWQEWSTHKAAGDETLKWDEKGPGQSPLRFRVKKGDFLTNREAFEKSKIIDCAGKVEKNMAAADAAAKVAMITSNVGRACGSADDLAEIGNDLGRVPAAASCSRAQTPT